MDRKSTGKENPVFLRDKDWRDKEKEMSDFKEIRVDSITRVEGHGNIYIRLSRGKVRDVLLEIPEGPRLFETLVLGKEPREVVNIVPRICAICNISHRYAAIRALEKILALAVPPEVVLLRNLMHYGEMIESHSLHLFFLALPDFLGYPDALTMVEKYPEEVNTGLRLKKFGNYVMETIAGRMIHGENPTVGGFGRFLTKEELQSLRDGAERLIPEAIRTTELFRNLHYSTYAEEGMLFACLKPPTDTYGFWGDEVMISNGDDRTVEEFRVLIKERVYPHSTAKRTLYKERPYVVGAIARMNLLGERLHGAAREAFQHSYSLSWIRNPLYNNLAQAIEIVFALEEIVKTADRLLKIKKVPRLLPITKGEGKGVGAVEAPRGSLFHYYEFDDGVCTKADLIIPTAQNYNAMERHLRVAAENLFSNSSVSLNQAKSELEMLVRAYDPCISCSCHIVEIDANFTRSVPR
jgi:sulfhydrogenase subunit alpha|uniref:Ni/Fe hydrogenase subunit alpha n=1 Tax=candidate division WOR-3 bacterium TaxID=2052148 RepID=A0A7C3YTE7_UNCW3